MANEYVTIASSNGATTKRFKAEAMRIITRRTTTLERTIAGGYDAAEGQVYTHINMSLFVPYATGDANYGTLADLIQLYSANNPLGTPTNVVAFTDYYGVAHTAYFVGDLTAEPVCIILDGTEGYYMVPIELAIIPPAGAST